MWPACLSLLFLAFPSLTESPLLPLLSELQASLPASLRQDRERQACYKLVLSPQRLQLITSWGGQQRAVRTPSRIVFLRNTGASTCRHFALHRPCQSPPEVSGSYEGIPKQHTTILCCHKTGYFFGQGFFLC